MELRLLIIGLFGLFACQTNSTENLSRVERLTQVLAENPTKENRDALITAYQDTISSNPEDAATNAPFYSEVAKNY